MIPLPRACEVGAGNERPAPNGNSWTLCLWAVGSFPTDPYYPRALRTRPIVSKSPARSRSIISRFSLSGRCDVELKRNGCIAVLDSLLPKEAASCVMYLLFAWRNIPIKFMGFPHKLFWGLFSAGLLSSPSPLLHPHPRFPSLSLLSIGVNCYLSRVFRSHDLFPRPLRAD